MYLLLRCDTYVTFRSEYWEDWDKNDVSSVETRYICNIQFRILGILGKNDVSSVETRYICNI